MRVTHLLISLSAFIVYSNSIADTLEGISLKEAPVFIAIEDPHEQAKAWAKCYATYEFFSQLFSDSQPANAKNLGNLANGAKLATLMSFFSKKLSTIDSSSEFAATWNTAKMISSSETEIAMTQLMARLEAVSADDNIEAFVSELTSTNFTTCQNNSELQQKYIDTWRELSASGLLEAPR